MGNSGRSLNAALQTPINKILKKKNSRVETDVIIMKSGATYYVESIQSNGDYHRE